MCKIRLAVACPRWHRFNAGMASTKSRQHIWSGRIKLAKSQAEHARKRAVEAARAAEADVPGPPAQHDHDFLFPGGGKVSLMAPV